MDVWLQKGVAAKSESLLFRLVHSPQQATAMSQNNIREAMHGAKRDYAEYAWEMGVSYRSGRRQQSRVFHHIDQREKPA
jgi:hypothetical protein